MFKFIERRKKKKELTNMITGLVISRIVVDQKVNHLKLQLKHRKDFSKVYDKSSYKYTVNEIKIELLEKEIKYNTMYLTKVEKAIANKVDELENYKSIWGK